MKNIGPKRSRRRLVAVIAGIAAVLAIGGGAALFTLALSADTPRASEIPRHVPADADTVVIAPYSETWWSKLGAMAPQELMLQAATPGEELAIENIGYSRSPDHGTREIIGTGPLRIFYIEAADDETAAGIASWLNQAPGYDHRLIHQNGTILSVTAVWVPEHGVPEKSIATLDSYRAEVSDKHATMWFNPGQELASLAGGADTREAKIMGTFLEKGFGFTPGTAWSGTSKDGDSWSGTFASGGVDPGKINFTEASSALMEERKVLLLAKDPATESSQTSYQVTDPGISALINSAAVTVPGDAKALGNSSVAAKVEPVEGAAVGATVDITGWNRAASADLSVTESVLTRSISASGNQMNVAFTYAPTDKK